MEDYTIVNDNLSLYKKGQKLKFQHNRRPIMILEVLMTFDYQTFYCLLHDREASLIISEKEIIAFCRGSNIMISVEG